MDYFRNNSATNIDYIFFLSHMPDDTGRSEQNLNIPKFISLMFAANSSDPYGGIINFDHHQFFLLNIGIHYELFRAKGVNSINTN